MDILDLRAESHMQWLPINLVILCRNSCSGGLQSLSYAYMHSLIWSLIHSVTHVYVHQMFMSIMYLDWVMETHIIIFFPWVLPCQDGKADLMMYFLGPSWGKVLLLQVLGHFSTQPSAVVFFKDCLLASDCNLIQGMPFSEYSVQWLMEAEVWCIPQSVSLSVSRPSALWSSQSC